MPTVLSVEDAEKRERKIGRKLYLAQLEFSREFCEIEKKHKKSLKKIRKQLESKYRLRELRLAHEEAALVYLNARFHKGNKK